MRIPLLVLGALAACGDKDTADSAADDSGPAFRDADGDGFTEDLDCDDANPIVHPAATETCDGVDQDCDGGVDEGLTLTAWADDDRDGFGDPARPVTLCTLDGVHVQDDTDCDDADPSVFPGAVERCDAADQDCDGAVDEGAADAVAWYVDGDGDGFGDPEAESWACEAPAGAVGDATDCDDADATVHPGAEEVCDDGVVNDCDGAEADAREGCRLSGAVDARDAETTISGPSAGSTFGQAIASAGDVDGDGVGDLLVGAFDVFHSDWRQGSAYLFHGPLSGAVASTDAAAEIVGTLYYGALGVDVLGPGDLNGDGHDDLVVGMRHSRSGETERDEGASVFVFHGPVSGTLTQGDADRELRVTTQNDHFGANLASGDLDGDGVVDLVTGTPYFDSLSLAVFYGPHSASATVRMADLLVYNDHPESDPGQSVAVGDVNGDGQDDLITGLEHPADLGGVEILYGPLGTGDTWIGAADVSLSTGTDERLGYGVAVGDTDGDGHADLVVSAPWSDDAALRAGGVYVVPGPVTVSARVGVVTTGAVFGEIAEGQAGAAFSVSDADGDGLADLLIGAPDAGAGRAYLMVGPVQGGLSVTDAVFTVQGGSGAGDVGQGVGVWDLNGDLWPELFVGSTGTNAAGAVHVFDGHGY
ncbi:MAG: FG-GAP repeat protein [Alphaproteobacteria bacterium]|nr:FG-GAP repeat protein [Alphaproteobacteria bacterium]